MRQDSQFYELQDMLVSGEEVLLRARFHNAIYWKPVAVLILAVLFAVFVAASLAILLAVVGALWLCVAIMTKHYLLFAITNKRVLARYGLLQMDVTDIRLSMIESIDLERMLPGHIFGYSNVVVAGTGQRLLRVPFIANANVFRRFYNEMVLSDEGSAQGEENVRQERDAIAAAQNTSHAKPRARKQKRV